MMTAGRAEGCGLPGSCLGLPGTRAARLRGPPRAKGLVTRHSTQNGDLQERGGTDSPNGEWGGKR